MNQAHYILLRDKLIPDYTSAYSHVEQMYNIDTAKQYLKSQNLHTGICYAAKDKYHEIITNTPWIEYFQRTFMGFWSRVPMSCTFHGEILRSLEIRIWLMKKLVANYESGLTKNPQVGIIHPNDTVQFY